MSLGRLNPDSSTVAAHDFLRQRQPDTDAPIIIIAVQALEEFENLFMKLRRDADAVIGHRELPAAVFFCGGDKDEFDKWRKGLGDLSESRSKRKQQAQQTLQIEMDDEAFDRLYGHASHPIPVRKGRQVAVRVISQFGEESTKVVTI